MKRWIAWAAALFLLLPGSKVRSQASDAAGRNTLRMMSYNIRNGMGIDDHTDYDRTAAAILRVAPDVVAVQEVDSVTRRSGQTDVLRVLAVKTGLYPVFAPAISYDGGQYGIGLLSKEKPVSSRYLPLPGREEARALLVVEFPTYVFCCTHLSLTPEDGIASVPVIRRVAEETAKPLFIAGDWNATNGSQLLAEMQKDFQLLNDPKQPTFPADRPDSCLDYIAGYVGKGKPFVCLSSAVVDEPLASDHRPIVAEVRLEATRDTLHLHETRTDFMRSSALKNANDPTKALPRANASEALARALPAYFEAVEKAGHDLHSLMIVRHGQVVAERWMGEGAPDKPHVLHSVSKTFTATAIGFAVAEGKLKVTDQVISFFPDRLPATVSPRLKKMEIRHLLTMSTGHDVDPTDRIQALEGADWAEEFLATPLEHDPGTQHVYNSLATYMLSAILQRVTGEKVIDYLSPRLFQPLGIEGVTWEESPQGINCGGWGLYVKTEDMAKLGLFILQKGSWNGQQLLPASWIEEASASKIDSYPAGMKKETLAMKSEDSDWLQGYGYQMWRCRHQAFRADGAYGQFIIMLPEKDAVIVTTAHIRDMQAELNLIWDYLLPALK